MTRSFKKLLVAPGLGIACALICLLGAESLLHTTDFLQQYRSVFAAGRAGDKALFAQTRQPQLIFLGNSRVDNAISPQAIADSLVLDKSTVFNFGIPGVNTRSMIGISNFLGSDTFPQRVIIGLDETLFSLDDALSYSVFFGDRKAMWNAGEYRAWFASVLRLWGFSSSLKGLREPAKMQRFLQASVGDEEPWGGALTDNLGFRAKHGHIAADTPSFEYHQAGQALRPIAIEYFFQAIDKMQKANIEVAVFLPPVYRSTEDSTGDTGKNVSLALQSILDRLEQLGIKEISSTTPIPLTYLDFSDRGHLNQTGAQKFSRSLSTAIQTTWPTIATAQ